MGGRPRALSAAPGASIVRQEVRTGLARRRLRMRLATRFIEAPRRRAIRLTDPEPARGKSTGPRRSHRAANGWRTANNAANSHATNRVGPSASSSAMTARGGQGLGGAGRSLGQPGGGAALSRGGSRPGIRRCEHDGARRNGRQRGHGPYGRRSDARRRGARKPRRGRVGDGRNGHAPRTGRDAKRCRRIRLLPRVEFGRIVARAMGSAAASGGFGGFSGGGMHSGGMGGFGGGMGGGHMGGGGHGGGGHRLALTLATTEHR